jgi:hypothetical protein
MTDAGGPAAAAPGAAIGPRAAAGHAGTALAAGFAFGLVLLCGAADAAADMLPDAEGPGFQAALATWLGDDDEAALPALAAEAEAGDEAAQILLSLIEDMPQAHAPWTASLEPDERLALLRDPHGRPWLETAAAAGAPLALALEAAPEDPERALALIDLGEPRAARLALLAHAAAGGDGFSALTDDPRYPRELLYLALAETPEAAEAEALDDDDPQRAIVDDALLDETALAVWLRNAPLADPLSLFCADACGDDPESCRLAAYRALGGYPGLFSLGPPSEMLAPPDIWHASPKGLASIPRLIAVRSPDGVDQACLAEAVAAAVSAAR